MADPNRELLESAVRLLVPVIDELVFVGGCTTGLFITDPAAGGVRPTKDVDAIVDVTSYAEYTELAERLRGLGGRDDIFASHDLEDIIAVVDGRPEIVGDIAGAAPDVRAYVAAEIRTLLDNEDFVEALPGFLLPDSASQARRGSIAALLRTMSTPRA